MLDILLLEKISLGLRFVHISDTLYSSVAEQLAENSRRELQTYSSHLSSGSRYPGQSLSQIF